MRDLHRDMNTLYHAAMLSFFQVMDDFIAVHLTPHSPAFRLFFTRLTHFAGIYFISVFGTFLIVLFAITGFYEFAYGLAVALGGSSIVSLVLKRFFMRERPALPLVVQDGHSLPSGHAACSLALYGYLSYLLMKLWPSPLFLVVVLIFTCMVLAIGFSRVYLRVHHTSDVLLGYFIGAVFLALAIALF